MRLRHRYHESRIAGAKRALIGEPHGNANPRHETALACLEHAGIIFGSKLPGAIPLIGNIGQCRHLGGYFGAFAPCISGIGLVRSRDCEIRFSRSVGAVSYSYRSPRFSVMRGLSLKSS